MIYFCDVLKWSCLFFSGWVTRREFGDVFYRRYLHLQCIRWCTGLVHDMMHMTLV